jgi:hypothetical protein
MPMIYQRAGRRPEGVKSHSTKRQVSRATVSFKRLMTQPTLHFHYDQTTERAVDLERLGLPRRFPAPRTNLCKRSLDRFTRSH